MSSPTAEPIVTAPKAWSCIALNVIAAALVVRELWPLTHRAFPKDVFLSSGSPMHFMSQRCKLLLVCAVLHTVNCVNFAAHYAVAFVHVTYNALTHRTIHAIAGQPVIVLVSLATLQRCFALVILDGDARARRLWWATLSCGLLAVFNTCTAAYWAVEVHRDRLLTAAERLDARFLASWAFLPATCAPLACMSVCIWSVFKLRGQTPRRSPSGSSSSAIRFQVKGRRARSRSQQPSKMAAPSATSDSQTQSHSSTLAASSKVGTTSTATEPASSHVNSGTSPYPIKRSLNLLNYSIMGVWIAYAGTVLIPTQLLASSPVSTHSFVMVYVSVIVTLESSFEKLVKRHRKRRRKPVAEEENNDPGWGMGGGAVSIMAEAGETGEAAGGPKSGQVGVVGTAVATAVDGNGGHRALEVGQEVVANPTLCL